MKSAADKVAADNDRTNFGRLVNPGPASLVVRVWTEERRTVSLGRGTDVPGSRGGSAGSGPVCRLRLVLPAADEEL